MTPLAFASLVAVGSFALLALYGLILWRRRRERRRLWREIRELSEKRLKLDD